MALAFEIAYPDPAVSGSKLWESVARLLQDAGMLERGYAVSSRRPIPPERIAETLSRRRTPFFDIEGAALSIRHGSGKGPTNCLTFLIQDAQPPMPVLDQWVIALQNLWSIHYARLYDEDWEDWQNTKWIPTIEGAGRSTVGLQRVWDPTYDREIIDVSKNSGRLVDRLTFMEALGHVMWLPARFWKLTRASRPEVCSHLSCRELNDVTVVTLSELPFNDENPIPEEFRRLLFP